MARVLAPTEGASFTHPPPATDKVAVELASIDRLSVDVDAFPVDPARIDWRLVDCRRGSVTHMVPPPPDDDETLRVARMTALKKALRDCVTHAGASDTGASDTGASDTGASDTGASEHRQRRPAPLLQRRLAEHDLIDEITSAAQGIANARDWNGDPVYRTDGIWRVLATVARSQYCLAIADLGRALGIRKQAARELAHAAVRARVIELAPNPHDKRILQALVTPTGRAALAGARIAENAWLAVLLNGLDDNELKATVHVVRIIRQRLERDARERDRQMREQARQRAERARRRAFLPE